MRNYGTADRYLVAAAPVKVLNTNFAAKCTIDENYREDVLEILSSKRFSLAAAPMEILKTHFDAKCTITTVCKEDF